MPILSGLAIGGPLDGKVIESYAPYFTATIPTAPPRVIGDGDWMEPAPCRLVHYKPTIFHTGDEEFIFWALPSDTPPISCGPSSPTTKQVNHDRRT